MRGISLFTGAYALARRSGLLATRLGSSLFIQSYFQYKRRLEDPFDGLIQKHPQLKIGANIHDYGENNGY